MRHPEDYCHRCQRPNVVWSAPSPLWNAVMRGGTINGGPEGFDGIICPVCFAELAEVAGVADLWEFRARRVHVELETVTPSGRVWDEATGLWVEPDRDTPERRQERALWLRDIAQMLREQSASQNHPEFLVAADWLDPPMVRLERELAGDLEGTGGDPDEDPDDAGPGLDYDDLVDYNDLRLR